MMKTRAARETSFSPPALPSTVSSITLVTIMLVFLLGALVLLAPPLAADVSATRGDLYARNMRDSEQNNSTGVIDRAGQSTKHTPHSGQSYVGMGQAHNRRGKYAEAIAAFTKALQIEPGNARAYEYRGYSYFRQGDLSRAIQDLDRALELDPGNLSALYARGTVRYRMKDYALAAEDFGTVLKRDPSNTSSRQWRGRAYLKAGKPGPALEDFTHIIEHYQAKALTYYGRGLARIELEQYEAAVADFDEALRQSRERHAPSYNGRGLANYIMGNFGLAAYDFTLAINLDNQEAEFYYNRGRAFYMQQEYVMARKDFEHTLALSRSHQLAHMLLWHTRMMTGDIKQSDDIPAIRHSLGLDAQQDHNAVLLKVSEAYLRQGNRREACRWAKKAQDVLDIDNAGPQHTMQISDAIQTACHLNGDKQILE